MIGGRCPDRLGRELPPLPVDSNDRVRVLVRIDPDDHHVRVLLHSMGEKRRTGRRADPSRGDTTLLSSHAGRSVTVSRAARRTEATKAQSVWSEPTRPAHTDTGVNGVTTR